MNFLNKFQTLAAAAIVAVSTAILITPLANAQVIYLNADVNLVRAVKALRVQDLDTASKYFHRAVRHGLGEEKLIPTLVNICAIDYARGDLMAAKKACDKVLARDRMNWRAYVNRGNVLTAQGEFDAAERDYRKALKIRPENKVAQEAYALMQAEYAAKTNARFLAEAK